MPRRDDYALAAGSDGRTGIAGAVARGTSSLDWGGVPPGMFDAAEKTIDWRVEATDAATNAVVGVALSGAASPSGIAVRLRSGDLSGVGVLDDDGRATFPIVDVQRVPVTESVAWNHDWRTAVVTVGVPVEESVESRDRVREFARSRLAEPGADAFLAEILAAEADY